MLAFVWCPVPEIYGALKAMKTGAAFKPDGLMAEFYQKYWDVVGASLCAVVRKLFVFGDLPASLRAGWILLLPKDGDDMAYPCFWHPIILLNENAKLITAILAFRLRTPFPDLFHSLQVCSVPERSLASLASLTRNMLGYTFTRQAPGILVSLDQAKAFNRVKHPYLFQVLKAFGFSPTTVDLFRDLYSNLQSSL